MGVARLSRAEQAAATRTALLAAARTVLLRDGFHGASVDAVAAEAGLTIGAIYSRFAGKADLVLALVEERIEELRVGMARGAEQVTEETDPAEVIHQWARWASHDTAWSLLLIEFRAHVARHPDLHDRYSELHERAIEGLADSIVTVYRHRMEVDREVAVRAARAGLATAAGATLAHLAEGSEFGPDLDRDLAFAITRAFIEREGR